MGTRVIAGAVAGVGGDTHNGGYAVHLARAAEALSDAAELPAAIAVLLASAYQFCQLDAKTEQHFFTGFPSYWNVVAFYLLIWRLDPWINLALIALFCVLVFIPVRYVYPSRTKAYQRITLAVVFTWGATVLSLFLEYPTPQPWVMWLSILCMGYYVAVSVFLMVKSKPGRGSAATSN